ncbi:1476_t:CDS:2 [Ambispora gerdemannii]|uniref:1476_t:CDS:1 n=1 Tax=Ambispora gerdemannii TaxID=144530 RepID=A0A9N9HAN1_9GLOM|nr:1476_t:CDS:2 [Ambispora gerdemannii]
MFQDGLKEAQDGDVIHLQEVCLFGKEEFDSPFLCVDFVDTCQFFSPEEFRFCLDGPDAWYIVDEMHLMDRIRGKTTLYVLCKEVEKLYDMWDGILRFVLESARNPEKHVLNLAIHMYQTHIFSYIGKIDSPEDSLMHKRSHR